MTTYADKFLPSNRPLCMFVTLIEGNNEFLCYPARGLLEVISTDAYGRIIEATFRNVSQKYPNEPGEPLLVIRPEFIYHHDHCAPTETPVTPQEVLRALRTILAQHGPMWSGDDSIDQAYELIERIERDGIVGAKGDTL